MVSEARGPSERSLNDKRGGGARGGGGRGGARQAGSATENQCGLQCWRVLNVGEEKSMRSVRLGYIYWDIGDQEQL